MTHLRLAKFAAIAAPLALFFSACLSTHRIDDPPSTSDVGGAESTSSSSASFMGQGGAAADAGLLDTTLVDAESGCLGDKLAWEKLMSTPSPCVDDSDCCVIVNLCIAEAQVVAKSQSEEAPKLWPYCPSKCNDCIPPAVDVACVMGQCRGHIVLESKWDSLLRADHCSSENKIVPSVGTTATHFGCGN